MMHLIEGYETIDRDVYRVTIYSDTNQNDLPYVSLHVDVDIKQYDTYVNDVTGILKDILGDVHSFVVVTYPDKPMFYIQSINFMDKLNGGGSEIIIGDYFAFNRNPRVIPFMMNDIEESIEDYINHFKSFHRYPSGEKCMTKMKRDYNIVRGFTRKLDVKDINIKLYVIRGSGLNMSSVAKITLNTPPENEDEKDLGLRLYQTLKPYGIRPQINGGPVIGDDPF